MPENIDKKRVLLALLLLLAVGGGIVLAKEYLPGPGETGGVAVSQEGKADKEGEVAGEEIAQQKEELKKQIDEIKKSITNLKPEDIKEQAAVVKIIKDLDAVAKMATESAKIFDVKGNLCEEVKRRFCE